MPEMTCCALLKTYQKFKKYLKTQLESISQLQPIDEMQKQVYSIKESTLN
jgi:hypothetical protein